MPSYAPHDGQFLLTPTPLPASGLRCLTLWDGHRLYFGDRLAVTSAQVVDGPTWVLIGHAYQSDPTRPCLQDELATLTRATVDDITQHWAGRWLLIGDGMVWTDAVALWRCLYRVADGRTCVGSAPYLLSADPVLEDRHALASGWAVPPRSGYRDLRVLLPSQVLDYRYGRLTPRPLLTEPPVRSDPTAVVQRLATRYRTVLAAIGAAHPNLWGGLSAGLDSRVVLAAAVAAGLTAQTYTYWRVYSSITRADLTLPPVLARAAGRPHVLVAPQGRNVGREAHYRELITAYETGPASIYRYYTRGHIDQFGPDAVLLNGFCGEVGRGFYTGKLPDPLTRAALDASHVPQTPPNRRALDELWTWWQQTPLANPWEVWDLREHFYWEARLTGWAAVQSWQLATVAPEQGLTYLSPLNCLAAFREIFSLRPELRRGGTHLKAVIGQLCPAVAGFPYNPPDSWPRRGLITARKVPAYLRHRLGRALWQ